MCPYISQLELSLVDGVVAQTLAAPVSRLSHLYQLWFAAAHGLHSNCIAHTLPAKLFKLSSFLQV
jgi:hypothetical protein